MHVTHVSGLTQVHPKSPEFQYRELSGEAAREWLSQSRDTEVRPLARPEPDAAATPSSSSAPTDDDVPAGLLPADYMNPVTHVRDVGHLRHEAEVAIEGTDGQHRLKQVLSFQAPDWARMMLVEYEPAEPVEAQGRAGLFLRPNNPFVEGEFPEETEGPFDLSRLEVHAFDQAAYRSETGASSVDAMPHYLLVTRDMDPPPGGKWWHVAIGQMRDDRSIEGTVTVKFSGTTYRPPLAVQFYYDAAEQQEQVGFFDPTPREPDGDNPGATQGEAMRWILFRAAEDLLEQLDFDGFLPVPVVVSTKSRDDAVTGAGGAVGRSGKIRSRVPAPGRMRARRGGRAQGERLGRPYVVPGPVWEREAGTDACRARQSTSPFGSFCDASDFLGDKLVSQPGELGGAYGAFWVLRDHVLQSGPNAGEMWRWDKNFDEPGDGVSIAGLIRHELMHVLGFIGPSQDYMASFDPPRTRLDRPFSRDEGTEWPWAQTVTRRHHYGPIASPSEHNPWRHTAEPGPRLEDGDFDSSHLMQADGDDLAQWGAQEVFMQPSGGGKAQEDVGVARDILLDVGYARGTWSIQDRRLPRHWFDPERSGHGVDFRRVEREDGSMQHFLHFYTYDEDGNPEWYIATDELSDRMVFESTLDYVTWDEERSPAAQIDPARSGTIRLDLDPPIDHPACADRREYDPDGNGTWLVAVLEFDLPDGSGTWCLEPLEFGREPAFPQEGSGSWFAADPDDSGWGLSVMTRNYGPRPIVNTVVYYYDEAGEPTWAIGTEGGDHTLPYGSVGNGVDIDMLHVNGFCRTCEPTQTTTESAGTLQMQINTQSMDAEPSNQIMLLDLTDRGPVGGSWHRENIGIKLLSSPHPNMSQ